VGVLQQKWISCPNWHLLFARIPQHYHLKKPEITTIRERNRHVFVRCLNISRQTDHNKIKHGSEKISTFIKTVVSRT
jgi:hypothetical protein